MNLSRRLLLGLAVLGLAPLAHALEETEFWQAFNLTEYKSGPFETRTNIELRTPEFEYLSYFRVSQKFYYKLNSTWTLAANPVWERARGSASGSWSSTYRLDLEGNLTLKFGDVTLKARNRYEVRRREGRGSEAFDRFREYVTLSVPADWLPGQTSYAIGNEFFFNIDGFEYTANRFYPVIIGFKVGETKWSTFGMIQSKKASNGDWSHNLVFGLTGNFSF